MAGVQRTVDVGHGDGQLDEVGVLEVLRARVAQLGREGLRSHRPHLPGLTHAFTGRPGAGSGEARRGWGRARLAVGLLTLILFRFDSNEVAVILL